NLTLNEARTCIMKKWYSALFAFLCLSVLVYVFFLRPTDEDRIRSRLTELSTAVRIDARGESEGARAARIGKAFGGVSTDAPTIDVPELEAETSPAELAGVVASAGGLFRDLSLDFGSPVIAIAPTKRTATVKTKATLGATALSGGTRREAREII